MFEISYAASILAPRQQVWRDIARFEAWNLWHADMEAYSTRGIGAGAVRTVAGYDGAPLLERLEVTDGNACRLVYTTAEGAAGLRNYVSTIDVDAVDQRSCDVHWSGRFLADAIVAQRVADYLYRFYQHGIDGLKRRHELPCLPPTACINWFRLLSPNSIG